MMKLKYLYITGIVTALNIVNTNTSLADVSTGPEEILCFFIFPPIIVIISVIIGIYGIKYVKNQKLMNDINDNFDDDDNFDTEIKDDEKQ